ncbi:trypsin-like peptidase domain-containing protein [Teredinibacter sp. KSP-S5-2]|uniref:trypsin-like peptidase domain-containing protein n=1 Tax=Teredinibacter sp. KSP-S5-2 TaxID=3034506 RepID=UPI002934C0B8|nr:trypsin-like peptidase domain-containing protein [Teredinibacter sp. KSP-S5-2]WNO08543.1 trypsin-like peptidase domain-containing protein [Teredinibacter sp. KSP-S5-2]
MLFFPQYLPHAGQGKSLLNKVLSPFNFAANNPSSYADAVDNASPSVVNLYARKQVRQRRHPLFNDPVFRHFFNNSDIPQQERMQATRGSGVIVHEDGYLLTNFHVINGVNEIIVALQDGREALAEIVGINRENDLAVLKIELPNLTPIPIGKPDEIRIGDVVLAIGNPYGMGQTVTQGIVSATRRRGLNISLFENFIQTDAAINPGNSGGALIDTSGRLLGINTANLDQSSGEGYSGGIGFAIPADVAMRTLTDIIEFGRVVRGWLGVQASPLTPQLANAFELPSTRGVLVTAVDRNSPAEKAGILPGDVIVRVNNQLIGSGRWAMQEVAESRPGDKIEIEVIRKGQPVQMTAILGTRPLES